MNNRFLIKLLFFANIFFLHNLITADYPYTGFAIGTDGQLYCRLGIDSSNLHGTGWANIAVPPHGSHAVTVKSCAVSAFGIIWIVDTFGFVLSAQLTQSHLQKTSPGQSINLSWTNRENPAPNVGIREITVAGYAPAYAWVVAADDSIYATDYFYGKFVGWKGGPNHSARLKHISASPYDTYQYVFGVTPSGVLVFRNGIGWGNDWNPLGDQGVHKISILGQSNKTPEILRCKDFKIEFNKFVRGGTLASPTWKNIGNDFTEVAIAPALFSYPNNTDAIIWWIDRFNNIYLRHSFNSTDPNFDTGNPLRDSGLKFSKVTLGPVLGLYPR